MRAHPHPHASACAHTRMRTHMHARAHDRVVFSPVPKVSPKQSHLRLGTACWALPGQHAGALPSAGRARTSTKPSRFRKGNLAEIWNPNAFQIGVNFALLAVWAELRSLFGGVGEEFVNSLVVAQDPKWASWGEAAGGELSPGPPTTGDFAGCTGCSINGPNSIFQDLGAESWFERRKGATRSSGN